jgi:excisionase family DNA binding protein
MNQIDDLMTVEEVASLLKVKVSWVYDRISDSHGHPLPHVRLGRYIRFERAAVIAFIQQQRKAYPFAR